MKRKQGDSPRDNKKRDRINDNISRVLTGGNSKITINENTVLMRTDIYECNVGGGCKIPAPKNRGLPKRLPKAEVLNCVNLCDEYNEHYISHCSNS